MKKLPIALVSLALLSTAAFAGTAKEHCVTRNVTSNDNSLQGISTVCTTAGGIDDAVKKDDCETKRS